MSRRDRRALISGAITIATLVTLSRGLPAWRTWRYDARGGAVAATTDLARARALLRLRGPLGDSLSARGDRLIALAPALLGGESPATAGATLAGLVSGAAAGAGVRLDAVQIRPDSLGASAFTRVSVRADAAGDVRGVTRMLASLERGPALIAVRSLSIDQPEPAAAHDAVEQLRVTIVVEGLMLTPRARGSGEAAHDANAADTSAADASAARESAAGRGATDTSTTGKEERRP